MKEITFISGNPKKAEQLELYLNHPIAHHQLDIKEVQSLDLEEVIREKAKEAFQQISKPLIVDDASLIIHAMGKLPGPFIKFFLKELGPEKICQIAALLNNSSATAEVAIGYHNGKEVHIFKGAIEGRITQTPGGESGFGWDLLFIPQGYNKTRAQLNKEEYDLTSPRRIALELFRDFLKADL